MVETIKMLQENLKKIEDQKREREYKKREEFQKRRKEKRAAISAEMEEYYQKLERVEPLQFNLAVSQDHIVNQYDRLLRSKDYANQKLEELKDVKLPTKLEAVLYTILELFLGVFVIYSLLYRVMGSEYFGEVTMTFGTGIDPLYIALGFEAAVIVMFSLGMKLYITARFDEKKKEIVALWMKSGFIAFVIAYAGFVYLSNL